MHTKIDVLLTAIVLAIFIPLYAFSATARVSTDTLFAHGQPFERDLVVTAYYSPLPSQCCYVKGSFTADTELNGEGVHGADGTDVYPGMVAAPPGYPFGTRLVLPGIGTVTVHDRGGAIQELSGADRLDLWVGFGEEGLARALAFGVQHIHAVVYPPEKAQPSESIDLTRLPAPVEKLKPYLADGTTLFDIHAATGDHTASVSFLQERLKALGYFTAKPNGVFGVATQKSLQAFYADMKSSLPSDRLTASGASLIEAAFDRLGATEPIAQPVTIASAPASIAEAQRTLRFLGFYKGRTDGNYTETFRKAVVAFQKAQKLIASETSPGAGRIGPVTRKAIVALWRRTHTEMLGDHLLAIQKIDQALAAKGYDISHYLAKGDHGDAVRMLQTFLATKGYLEKGDATGSFGAKTEQALVAYQKDAGIIKSSADPGAGYAGPATLAYFRQDVKHTYLLLVRAKGWSAI